MRVSPRHAATLSALCLLSTTCLTSPSRADDWTQIGLSGRPSWVVAGAERRLRLLAGLPSIETTIGQKADATIGNQGPGLAVGLVLDDGLYYSRGFGYADTAKMHRPTEDSVFRPGSLSKVVTGTAMLTLLSAPTPQVKWGDPADKFVPELKYVCPASHWKMGCARGAQSNGITISNLLTHTTGLSDEFEGVDNKWISWRNSLEASYLQFQPGHLSAYSGVGTEVVGLIESRLSGLDYPEFVRERLFQPLGMTSSSMDPEIPVAGHAQMYSYNSTAKTFSPVDPVVPGDHATMLWPAGGFATNVRDLSHFMQMFLTKTAPTKDGHPIISEVGLMLATNPLYKPDPSAACMSVANPGPPPNDEYRACGPANTFGVNWVIGPGPSQVWHNGSIGVSGSNTILDLKTRMGVTALMSTDPTPTWDITTSMLNGGAAADAATNWTGKAQAIGVARLLNLTGKVLTPGDLANFTPSFANGEHVNSNNIVAYLNGWRNGYGACHTFRVIGSNSVGRLSLVLNCTGKSEMPITIFVEPGGAHRINFWSYTPAP